MNYHLGNLQDFNPNLCLQLKRYCYEINGCCQTVHKELGPFLNEYMYQDALEIIFNERAIPHTREYYFSVDFHGQQIRHKHFVDFYVRGKVFIECQQIRHKHFVDFYVRGKVFIECKAVASLGPEQRQQLWNYMRLTKVRIGILYNFAPIRDQSEHYYLDTNTNIMYFF